MKYYKLTLLRDLPTVDAGYSFTVDEKKLREWDFYHGHIYSKEEEKENEVLNAYKLNPNWVNVEVDTSKGIPIACPNCGKVGLFLYEDPIEFLSLKQYSKYQGNYVQKVGLECVCGYKIETNCVYIGYRDSQKTIHIREDIEDGTWREPHLNKTSFNK